MTSCRQVQSVHVLTVTATLPMATLDRVLTRVEAMLHDIGATRMWVDPDLPALAIVAEFPMTDLDEGGSAVEAAR